VESRCEASLSSPLPKDEVHAIAACTETPPPWKGEVIVTPLRERDEVLTPIEEPLEKVPPPLPPEVVVDELFGSPMNVLLLFPPWEDGEVLFVENCPMSLCFRRWWCRQTDDMC
jgi:hypothetical protein